MDRRVIRWRSAHSLRPKLDRGLVGQSLQFTRADLGSLRNNVADHHLRASSRLAPDNVERRVAEDPRWGTRSIQSGRSNVTVRERRLSAFQNVALFEGLPVLDNICTGADHAATRVGGPVSSKVIAEELIATTGLREFTNAPVSTLSAGYRKRVEIARAVAGNSRLLLLDEPTAGILPRDAVSIMELVQGLRRGRGLTVLLSSIKYRW